MLTGLLLGITGSLHCVGMCGPLNMLLPIQGLARFRLLGTLLTFHAGRIFTYALLGILVGILGKGLHLAGIQQVFAIAVGIIMVLTALFSLQWSIRLATAQPIEKFNNWVKNLLKNTLRGKSLFLAGMANGLLPCGMVYIALAGALSAEHWVESSLFMLFFGLGTIPALVLTIFAGKILPVSLRTKFRYAQPILLGATGALILFRALHLDLSAWNSSIPGAVFNCH